MTCDEVTSLLGPFHDDEIQDPLLSLRISEHLEGCEGCAQRLAALSNASQALRAAQNRFEAPEGLRARVASVAGIKGNENGPSTKPRGWGMWSRSLLPAFAVAGVLLAVFYFVRPGPAGVEVALVADHVRSLQAGHLFDVPSSNQHTVKPWFQGRIDFSPAVPDLSAEGYPLLGGRLDYLLNRPAAAIVYGRGKHVINVFVVSGDAQLATSGVADQSGYHILAWSGGGLNYWAVSDVNSADMESFRNAFVAAGSSPRSEPR